MVTPARWLGDPPADSNLVNQTSASPTRKVQAASLVAALTAVLAWADDEFWGNRMDGLVEAAFITLGVAAAGWLTRNKSTDAPPAPGVPDTGHVDALLIVLVAVAFVLGLLVRPLIG